MSKLAVLIMAAGRSSRFNGCKLLAEVQAKPLLQHSIDKALAINPDRLLVVSGAWHQALVTAISRGDLSQFELAVNPNWAKGLGNSIAFGINTIGKDYDAVLIMLADQIALSIKDLQTLTTAAETSAIACANYGKRLGVPAIFKREYYPDLLLLNGDKGAQQLLRNTPYTVSVNMPNAAIDIDSQADLRRFN